MASRRGCAPERSATGYSRHQHPPLFRSEGSASSRCRERRTKKKKNKEQQTKKKPPTESIHLSSVLKSSAPHSYPKSRSPDSRPPPFTALLLVTPNTTSKTSEDHSILHRWRRVSSQTPSPYLSSSVILISKHSYHIILYPPPIGPMSAVTLS